jgi:3-mercaptopyruvate sulfurtransferase SseA
VAGGGITGRQGADTCAEGRVVQDHPNQRGRATLPEVLTASGDPAGQIPDGILLPSADLYNADETFESPDELRRMLRSLNIRPDQHEAREE